MFKFLKFRRKYPSFLGSTPEERKDFYAEYGQVMRNARESMGISLAELSKRLLIDKQALSNYERGTPVPYVEGIAIYQYLGMRQRVFNQK